MILILYTNFMIIICIYKVRPPRPAAQWPWCPLPTLLYPLPRPLPTLLHLPCPLPTRSWLPTPCL